MKTPSKEQLESWLMQGNPHAYIYAGTIEIIHANLTEFINTEAEELRIQLAISEARCDGLTIQRDTKDRQNTELKQRVAKTEMERSFCEENAFRLQAKLSAKEKEFNDLRSKDVGPKCEVCNWTNCGCLRVQGKLMCHGCIDREIERLRAELAAKEKELEEVNERNDTNRKICDNVDNLLSQSGFSDDCSIRNQLGWMNFSPSLPQSSAPTLRQEFEEWADKSGIDTHRDALDGYAVASTHLAWLAYQARAGKEKA